MTIEIQNPIVEDFLQKEIQQNSKNLSEYIVSVLLKEIELKKAKKDMQILNDEFMAYKQGDLELNSVENLLKEL
jgi:ribosomal protein S7